MEREPLGVFSELQQRASKRGRIWNTYPELRCCHRTEPSNQRIRSNYATSCRTRHLKIDCRRNPTGRASAYQYTQSEGVVKDGRSSEPPCQNYDDQIGQLETHSCVT